MTPPRAYINAFWLPEIAIRPVAGCRRAGRSRDGVAHDAGDLVLVAEDAAVDRDADRRPRAEVPARAVPRHEVLVPGGRHPRHGPADRRVWPRGSAGRAGGLAQFAHGGGRLLDRRRNLLDGFDPVNNGLGLPRIHGEYAHLVVEGPQRRGFSLRRGLHGRGMLDFAFADEVVVRADTLRELLLLGLQLLLGRDRLRFLRVRFGQLLLVVVERLRRDTVLDAQLLHGEHVGFQVRVEGFDVALLADFAELALPAGQGDVGFADRIHALAHLQRQGRGGLPVDLDGFGVVGDRPLGVRRGAGEHVGLGPGFLHPVADPEKRLPKLRHLVIEAFRGAGELQCPAREVVGREDAAHRDAGLPRRPRLPALVLAAVPISRDGAADRADVHAGRTHHTVELLELIRELQDARAGFLAVAAQVHQPPASKVRLLLEGQHRLLGLHRLRVELLPIGSEFRGDSHQVCSFSISISTS